MLQAKAARLDRLHQRARILQAIRAFFIAQDFLEVETPHRIPVNAPEAHIHPFTSEAWQLQTSPELAMKRLLAAGAQRLFQLCRCWRKEERSPRHLTEFTLLEWYRSHTDYQTLMDDCEALFAHLCPRGRFVYQGQTIDLQPPWQRLTVDQAFHQFAQTGVEQAIEDGSFDERYAFEIEPQLGQGRPTFLTEFPASHAALARKKPGNPCVAERFELYIGGMELANGFSELTDPVEQRQRFIEEQHHIGLSGRETGTLPAPFLEDLKTMPDSAGIALGVDRLLMVLFDLQSIDEIVAFTPEDL